MSGNSHISVGYVRKIHGTQGELRLVFDHDLIALPSYLFVGDQNPLPYFIESIRDVDQGAFLVKFEEVNGREEAQHLSGKAVQIKAEDLDKVFKVQKDNYSYLIGFELRSDKDQKIGKIIAVEEMPLQTLLTVEIQGAEALIPLHEEMILSKDVKSKQIVLNLPEGLLDLYL